MSFPSCFFAGKTLTDRRFCRHDKKPKIVSEGECNSCPFSMLKESSKSPECSHRGSQVGSISCSCPHANTRGIYECSKYGKCVLSNSDRENIQGVKSCENCSVCLSSRSDVDLSELAIIAVHFNPERYNLPIRNYWEWRNSLGSLQENLITVELSYDERFVIHDSDKITGDSRNVMWQKERLINRTIKRLPSGIKYVAWIDHDLIFENENWAVEAIQKLESGCDVVQLFETITYLDKWHQLVNTKPGSVASVLTGSGSTSCSAPGGAWMARREYLDSIGGLLDNNILGGGDNVACDAWLGTESHYMDSYAGKLAESARKWQEKTRENFKGVDFVPGNVRHLYHGEKSNRGYLERAKILSSNNFDPETDIFVNGSGTWEVVDQGKKEMWREIADYFRKRKEDS